MQKNKGSLTGQFRRQEGWWAQKGRSRKNGEKWWKKSVAGKHIDHFFGPGKVDWQDFSGAKKLAASSSQEMQKPSHAPLTTTPPMSNATLLLLLLIAWPRRFFFLQTDILIGWSLDLWCVVCKMIFWSDASNKTATSDHTQAWCLNCFSYFVQILYEISLYTYLWILWIVYLPNG